MMISFTLNGKPVQGEADQTILQVAEKYGVKIPTLCFHKALEPAGMCRLCTVELFDGRKTRFVTACNYPIWEGMAVQTETPAVHQGRKLIVELLLARCPEVPLLQKLAKEYGLDAPRFKPEGDSCILCGLCVRMCEKIGNSAISLTGRGLEMKVDTPFHLQTDRCLACGACASVCPTGHISIEKIRQEVTKYKTDLIPSEFNMGLGGRKPIYIPFPQAVPNTPTIDPKTCLHFKTGGCQVCTEFCESQAIDHSQKEEIVELEVGSIILAPGFEPYPAEQKPELGHGRYPNVLTSLEYERLLSAGGPFQGHVARPSDHQEPTRIAWIQCVGSRDASIGNDYCSYVCCMYATKQAVISKEHLPGVEAAIFFIDIRAQGKGFDRYYERAKQDHGVRYVRSHISRITEDPRTHDLQIAYIDEHNAFQTETFDLVILSVGLKPHAEALTLARTLGVQTDRFGFCRTPEFNIVGTSQPGIFVSGVFQNPKDIPETVTQASGAAAEAAALLSEARGTQISEMVFPEERGIQGEEPRIGVLVCHCGINIAGIVDVEQVTEFAATLPGVVYADHFLFTCSTDSQDRMQQVIQEKGLNRVIVASCSPRTHEGLFQETLRKAGLNKYLFEMANIRDQCSWVHQADPAIATEKAKDLVRMSVARAELLEPLYEIPFRVNQKALVVGGGVAGLTAALNLADQGFETYLVEKSARLGGNALRLAFTLEGFDVNGYLKQVISQVQAHPKIRLLTQTNLMDIQGHIGKFKSTIEQQGKRDVLEYGAVVVATGGSEYIPEEYAYGSDPRVQTQLELHQWLSQEPEKVSQVKQVVMIQCVGSREEAHPYCSRVCCSTAVANALKIKEINPQTEVIVLYRDMRTYGQKELFYKKAREAGVRFVRFEPEAKPEVTVEAGRLNIRVIDQNLRAGIIFQPDYLVLSAAVRPTPETKSFASLLKLPLDADGFFLEAHIKLRPLDFANAGMFLCGLGHGPKSLEESISQAKGAAARAATVLAQEQISVGGQVAVVDQERCIVCLTCVRTCPFGVPQVNEEGMIEINPAACQGCGNCASACPRKLIQVQNQRDDQIMAKETALFEWGGTARSWGSVLPAA